jgi:hypothetical protein
VKESFTKWNGAPGNHNGARLEFDAPPASLTLDPVVAVVSKPVLNAHR